MDRSTAPAPAPTPTRAAPDGLPRWFVIALWTAVLSAVAIVAVANPSQTHYLPRCAFHALTGLNCPGCGATRALHHLVHAHILTALRCNALFVLALPFLLYALLSLTRESFAGRPLPMPRFSFSSRWIFALVAVLVVFAVLRNIPAVPFVYLSPP